MTSGTWLLRCICDETRFGMLEMLQSRQELCVGDFVAAMEKDQPLISHHLRRLRECGILASRYEGKKTMYRISSPRLAELISSIAEAGREIPDLCGSDDDAADCRC